MSDWTSGLSIILCSVSGLESISRCMFCCISMFPPSSLNPIPYLINLKNETKVKKKNNFFYHMFSQTCKTTQSTNSKGRWRTLLCRSTRCYRWLRHCVWRNVTLCFLCGSVNTPRFNHKSTRCTVSPSLMLCPFNVSWSLRILPAKIRHTCSAVVPNFSATISFSWKTNIF